MEVDETKDVNNAGDGTENAEGSSSDAKTDQHVPYDRFKEVNDQKRELEQRVEELQQQKSSGTLSPEEQKELQAKEYLGKLLDERIEARNKATADAEKAEQKKFENDVSDVLSAHTDVKRSDFVAFLEKEGDDYSSVASAMKGYLRLGETAKEAAEKAKDNQERKPKMPNSEGAGGGSFAEPPEADKSKSFWEVAQDAMRGVKK